LVETALKTQEAQVLVEHHELANVIKEKEALEAALADITRNTKQMAKLHINLEEKLRLSDELE